MPPWVGIFWMVLAAVFSQVSRPVVGLRWAAIAYWAALFVAGLVWFIVAHRREAERVKVLRGLDARKGSQ